MRHRGAITILFLALVGAAAMFGTLMASAVFAVAPPSTVSTIHSGPTLTTVTPKVPKNTTTSTRPLGPALGRNATVPAKAVTDLDMFSSYAGVATAHLPATTFGVGRYYLVSTMNGGVTWQVMHALPRSLTPSEPLLLQMAFVSQEEGYLTLVGSKHVAFTENGGRTWVKVNIPGHPTAMSLSGASVWFTTQQCPANTRVKFGCPTMLATVPIGSRRANLIAPIPLEGPAALESLPSGQVQTTLIAHVGADGWAVEDGGPLSTLLITLNGGVSWQLVENPCTKLFPTAVVRNEVSGWALYCTLDGGMNQGTNELWTSSDAGQHWTLAAMANEEGATVGHISSEMMGQLTSSANGQILWLLGDVGGISSSTNGGSEWSGAPVETGGYQAPIATAGSVEAWLPIPGIGIFQTVNGTTWNLLSPKMPPGPSPAQLENVAFFNPNDGYGMFQSSGSNRCDTFVGATTDGGANFTSLHQAASGSCTGTLSVTQLAFDDHGDGFLFDPNLIVTHDGGSTWAPVHEPASVLSVEALGQSIWMVLSNCPIPSGPQSSCPLSMQQSDDGGRTWKSTYFPSHSTFIHGFGGMARLSMTSAYVLSNPDYSENGPADSVNLWFTSDSGASWSRTVVPCGIGAMTDQLSVAPDGTIFVACASEPSAGTQLKSIARSTDRGSRWQLQSACAVTQSDPQPACTSSPFSFGYLGGIDAISDDTVFLVGTRSSLLVTHDAGSYWSAVMPLIGGTDDGTSRVIFFDASDGLVFGNDSNNDEAPTIWHTSDGGAQWYPVVPQFAQP